MLLHISNVSAKWLSFLNNLCQCLGVIFLSLAFCLFYSAEDSKWLLVSRKPMDRRFHQSIKKHLPHTQHDLYLVNRIVSLYPYIIIALIPLAVCLMLFFKLTSRSTEIEGGISTILATIYSLISGNVVGQCLDSGHSFPLAVGILSFYPVYCCGIQCNDLFETKASRHTDAGSNPSNKETMDSIWFY